MYISFPTVPPKWHCSLRILLSMIYTWEKSFLIVYANVQFLMDAVFNDMDV